MDQPHIKSSYDAYALFTDSWEDGKMELQEQFRVMLLDRKNSVMGIATVATGGMSDCMVDLKLVFALALKARASSIIVAHNHPSGNDKFSDADKKLTTKLVGVGKMLDLPVLDHLVITKHGYSSFADNGLIQSAATPTMAM
ncbi:MAG: JAB domain-containing protein [Flavobacterium sp.]|nr:JAB domain-containing protein [Flavobacterium sp.]